MMPTQFAVPHLHAVCPLFWVLRSLSWAPEPWEKPGGFSVSLLDLVCGQSKSTSFKSWSFLLRLLSRSQFCSGLRLLLISMLSSLFVAVSWSSGDDVSSWGWPAVSAGNPLQSSLLGTACLSHWHGSFQSNDYNPA